MRSPPEASAKVLVQRGGDRLSEVFVEPAGGGSPGAVTCLAGCTEAQRSLLMCCNGLVTQFTHVGKDTCR